MMYYYYNEFFPFHIIGFVFSAIFWFVVVLIIISLLRGRRHHRYWGDRSMEILKERYAKGEITREQFENMKKDLLN